MALAHGRQVDQRNWTHSPEPDPGISINLAYDRVSTAGCAGKGQLLSKWSWDEVIWMGKNKTGSPIS